MLFGFYVQSQSSSLQRHTLWSFLLSNDSFLPFGLISMVGNNKVKREEIFHSVPGLAIWEELKLSGGLSQGLVHWVNNNNSNKNKFDENTFDDYSYHLLSAHHMPSSVTYFIHLLLLLLTATWWDSTFIISTLRSREWWSLSSHILHISGYQQVDAD